MPEKVVQNDFFGDGVNNTNNKMFAGSSERRHMENEDQASDHMLVCVQQLIEKHGLNPKKDIDMIITNVSFPDQPFTGTGAVLAKKIKGNVPHIVDLHNTGCVSFVYMLDMVQTYMVAKGVKSALICTSQTTGGRVFGKDDTRKLAQSCIPGDGTAVAYVTNEGTNKMVDVSLKNYPAFSEDMFVDYDGKNWWDIRDTSGRVNFSDSTSAQIITRGNEMVPERIYALCEQAGIKVTDLDYLITNQPNPFFLRNWREAILMDEEKHLNTFSEYANLFGSGIPVTLGKHIEEGTFKKGDLICLAGFSHAGDYSGAAIVEWGAE